jgi:hypothetical protein
MHLMRCRVAVGLADMGKAAPLRSRLDPATGPATTGRCIASAASVRRKPAVDRKVARPPQFDRLAIRVGSRTRRGQGPVNGCENWMTIMEMCSSPEISQPDALAPANMK